MPPIVTRSLNDEAASLISTLERRQKDLEEFQIPRLQNCTSSLADQQQYASELRQDLDAFEKQVEVLFLYADDLTPEEPRKEAVQRATKFRNSLTRLRKRYRSAVVSSKEAIDALGGVRKAELLRQFAGAEKSELDEKSSFKDDVLASTNQDLTHSLRRTFALMQKELEKSVHSAQLLESSTATMKSATSQHEILDTILDTARQLTKALENSDWLDRLIIIAALVFFVLVVLFILKQRLLDRGLRIAFWWTRLIPDFSGDAALDRLEKGKLLTATTSLAMSAVTATALSSSRPEMQLSDTLTPTTTTSVPSPEALTAPVGLSTTFSVIEEVLSTLLNEPASSGETQQSNHVRGEL